MYTGPYTFIAVTDIRQTHCALIGCTFVINSSIVVTYKQSLNNIQLKYSVSWY
jgi:hypothetical protein